MWNIKKLELRRIRTQATQQLACGLGSCGGGKRNQTRELEFPKTRTKEARQQRTTGLGSCKDGKREQSRVLQLPKNTDQCSKTAGRNWAWKWEENGRTNRVKHETNS